MSFCSQNCCLNQFWLQNRYKGDQFLQLFLQILIWAGVILGETNFRVTTKFTA